MPSDLNKLIIEIEAKDLLSPELNSLEKRLELFSKKAGKSLLKAEGGAVGGNAEVALGNLGSFAKAGQDADRALTLAARGVSGLGGAITSQLGPASGVVGGLTNEVVALGGGLDSLIGKAGLSEVALLGLGAGAAGVALGVGAVAVAAKATFDVEQGLKRAVVAAAGLGIAFEDLEDAALATSSATGVAFEDIGAAYGKAFEGGARSVEEARRQVTLAARAFQDAGLGSSVTSAFEELKSTAEAFGISAKDMPFLLNQIKVGALEAGQSTSEFSASLRQSALDAKRLGASREDIIKLTIAAAKGGASAEQAGRAVRSILNTLNDPGSSGFKLLQTLGVDLSEAAFRAKGFLGVIAEVRAAIGSSGQTANAAFGTKNAGPIQAALTPLPSDTARRVDEAGASLAALNAATMERLALASERLAQSWNLLSNSGKLLGELPLRFIATGANELAKQLVFVESVWNRVFGDTPQEKALRSADPITRVKAEIQQYEAALENLLSTKQGVEARKENPVTKAFDESSPVTKDLDARIEATRAKLEELRQQKLSIDGNVNLDTSAAETALGNIPKRITVEVELAQEQIADALKNFEGKTPPLKVEAQVSKLLDLASDPQALALSVSDGSFSQLIGDVDRYETAVKQAEDLTGSLRARSLVGAQKARAEGELFTTQILRQIAALKSQGVEESKLQEIRDQIPAVQAETGRTVDLSIAKQTADIEAKMLGLRATSLDRARDLALANGDVATADRLGVEAIQARADAAKALGEIEIANLREQLRGREDLKGQFEAIAKLIRDNADAEADAARAAVDRARDTRTRNTNDLVGDADSALLTGLDAEYDAIERNRRAAIRRAEDGVRAGTVEATALGYLIDQYGALADAERERLAQDVNLQRIEIEAGLVGELTDNYTATAYAIGLARSAERERLALSLAGLNAEQSEIEATLALFDQITQQRQFAAAVAASQRSSTQIEETILLEAAFQRATREAERMGLKGAEAGKYIQDAMLNARTGVDALSAGFRGGFDDFKRDIFDDFSFGAEAARNQAQTFKDSWIDAFGSIGQEGKDAGDILRDFGIANLRQLQKNAAEFAFNKLGQAVLGPPESRKDDGSFLSGLFGGGAKADPLQVSADRLTGSADRLDAAAIALGQAAVGGPTTQGGIGFFGSGFANSPAAIGPGVDGNPLGGFVGPQLPGFEFASGGASDVATQDGLAAELAAAGDTFSTAVEAGGQATAGALVSGGNVFASLLGGVANSLGSALSGFLSSGISASFAEGGRFQGRSMRTLSPLANRLGGKYTNRTLIEVAEIPGLEEAVIPLKGGAIPVEVKGGKRRQDPRLANGPFDELVQQLGRLDLQEQRLRADAPAERERQRARERSDFAVRQADTQRAPVSERRRVGVGADRGERRTAREGRRARAQVVQVGGGQPVVNVSISVSAGGSEDIGSRVREVVPYVVREVIRGLEGENRQLVNAVRGAVG